jgi:enoyl-CoA hydratase/carnithine racemase
METLHTNNDAGILVVTLDRPDALNAFNAAMVDELCDVFVAAGADPSVRVLVLTGAGRAFTAGADLKSFSAGQSFRDSLDGLLDSIIDFPKPFLLAINGVGVGIGCTIAGVADMAFIDAEARLRCPFTSLGLVPEVASTYTFPRLMGHQRAFWLLQSSQWWTSEQVVEAGLAFERCAPGTTVDRTMEHARMLAGLPQQSLRETKELLMGPRREAMRTAVRNENDALMRLGGGPANREAIAAFAEKRDPDFSSID